MNDLSTALGRVRNSLASNLGADGVLVLTKGDVAEVLALINQPANPQCEQVAHMPVERCYDVRAKMIIAFNEAKKSGGDLDDALDAAYKSALRYSPNPLSAEQHAPFQSRVKPWMLECFGETIAADRQERNHRFLEEALELVQANQCTASEAHQLVDYVYGRPVGDPAQEAGGVMVTLAALCLASGLDMHAEGETELARIWTKVEQIRAKQAAKPAMSPLPGTYPDREQPAPVAVVPDGYCIMPRQLTAENGAKALLLGEFKLLVTKECPECCELEEPVEGCSICDGEGEYGQKHTIPWDQLKYIYSKAVSGLAVKAEPAKS